MPLYHLLIDHRFRSAWRRTLELWKPMAMWTFAVWLVLTILVLPPLSALVQQGFFRGDRLVVSNEEIIKWLFTPYGLTALLLIGGLATVASVVRFAGIFQIVTCHMKEQPITLRQLSIEIGPKLPRLLRLSIAAIAISLAVTACVLSGIGLIYLIFLSGQDINYYLQARPPEWTYAIIAGCTWLLFSGGLILYSVARASVALPAFLDGSATILNAIRTSWSIMGQKSGTLLSMLGLTAIIWVVIIISADAILLGATGILMDYLSTTISGPRAVTTVAGTHILLSQLVRSIVGFIGFSFVSVLITKFYHEDTQLHEQAPPPPGIRQITSAFARGFDRYYTPARAILVAFILAAAGLGIGVKSVTNLRENPEVTIIAHRAGPPPAPENTLAALDLAIQQGADITEIDVMRTADDSVIVFHDQDLRRMTGDSRRIEETPYSELKKLVQQPDDGSPASKRRVVTLREMLLHGKNRIEFMIELKYYGFDTLLADEVLATVRKTGMMEAASIASLQIDPISKLTLKRPELETGYISAISIGNLAQLPVRYIAVQHQQISGQLINNAHEQNIKVYAWTANRPGRIASMINIGVDGIITDFPERAATIANEIRDMTLAERIILTITGWQGSSIQHQ